MLCWCPLLIPPLLSLPQPFYSPADVLLALPEALTLTYPYLYLFSLVVTVWVGKDSSLMVSPTDMVVLNPDTFYPQCG